MTIYQDIVKTYRGWRRFEKRRFADAFVITKGFHKFRSHKEILDKFAALNASLDADTPQDEYIKTKLIASIYYLRHKLGERIDYSDYLNNTIGVVPALTPEKKIENLTDEIKHKLQKLGIDYDKKDLDKKLALGAVDKRFVAELKKQKNDLLIKAEKYLGIRLSEKVYVKLTDEEKYWHYYINIKRNSFALKINTNHDRVKHKKGSLEYAIMHELCGHALQLSSWKKQIRLGKISEVCGCEEDYGPEIFSLEGVGESIFYYIFKNEIRGYLEIELMLDELEHLVQNNAYIMINSGHKLNEVTKYYADRVILKDKESIKKTLTEVRDDSFMRAHRYVYGSSLVFFKNAAKNLNPKQRRKFFRMLYLQPMTYTQIKSLYDKIKSRSHAQGPNL